MRLACHLIALPCLLLASLSLPSLQAQESPVPDRILQSADGNSGWTIPPADSIDRPFQVLIWQYKTNALNDAELYDSVGLRGFHIDRGEGQEQRAAWAEANNRPFYIDHAAGKGILHLTERSGLNDVPKDGSPAPRPHSMISDESWQTLTDRIQRHVAAVANDQTVAIALDDEVSLGTFNSPLEVGFESESVDLYRQWLRLRFESTATLQEAFRSEDVTFDNAQPVTFHEVRRQISNRPPAKWKLAPWLTFRAFMDRQQAALFAALSEFAQPLAKNAPVGVVGAQQPSVYGGFDYSLLRHSVQWMEAYDIGGTNEVLHSFWSESPRRARMQTFFSSGNLSQDKWFLWYYLAHGNAGVIAWPDFKGRAWFNNGKVDPHIQALGPTFRDIQSPALTAVTSPKTRPIFSDIGVLYSHPSIQVGWAIDASTHGGTWPRRSSSLDNQCLSSGKNRIAWTRLLEDIGYQARIVDTTELVNGQLTDCGVKVLILPQCFALSTEECAAIRQFTAAGGTVVADYGTAITDENGTGYEARPLDDVFGIQRSNDNNWFDGKRRFEINGEQYQQPFLKRLPEAGCDIINGLPVVERGIGGTWKEHGYKAGRGIFLNQSPTAYYDSEFRSSAYGEYLREATSALLKKANVTEPVKLTREDGRTFGVELIRYKTAGNGEVWCIVTNPTRQASVNDSGSALAVNGESINVVLSVPDSVTNIRDLRRGRAVEIKNGQVKITLNSDEAEVLEVKLR